MAGDGRGAVLEHLRTLFSVGAIGGLSDGHLLDLFVTGRDEAAFSALIERHGPMVLPHLPASSRRSGRCAGCRPGGVSGARQAGPVDPAR